MNLIDIILIGIYITGLVGLVLNKNNIINILIISELNLGTLGMMFVLASVELNDILGELSGLYILTFTAAESAIGLAIVVILYSKTGIINIRQLNKLKG
jgi:NADH-quinone oxidoreductase subunit K